MWRRTTIPRGEARPAAPERPAPPSKGKLSKQWIGTPGPDGFVTLEHLLGRRHARGNDRLDRLEKDGLFLPGVTQISAPFKARARDRRRLAGNLERGGAVHWRGQRTPRHLIAQRLPLGRAPVFDEIPGRVKAGRLVQ